MKRKGADLHYYSLKKLYPTSVFTIFSRFKTMFAKKDNGSAINWKLIQEKEIEIKFTECKQKMIDLLNLF